MYLKHVQSYTSLLAYTICLRPLTLEFNRIGSNSFYCKMHKIISRCPENCLLSGICIKGHNLVCNELAMLKIPDDVSET